VAGQAAYSAYVEVVEARDIDLVLSRPLEVGVLAAMLPRLEAALRGKGLRVAGGRLQLGKTPDEEAGGEGGLAGGQEDTEDSVQDPEHRVETVVGPAMPGVLRHPTPICWGLGLPPPQGGCGHGAAV